MPKSIDAEPPEPDDPPSDVPTTLRPGSDAKIELMRERLEQGYRLFADGDAKRTAKRRKGQHE